MRIDLHCHTMATKKGDPKSREVTPDLFCEKVSDANVEIVAITNHNTFDINQYKAIIKIIDENIQVWPGIELDIKSKFGNNWHLLVIANPKNVDDFSLSINKMINGRSPDTFEISFNEVYDFLNPHDVIYIPHIHKSPGINEEDRKSIEQHVENQDRIFYEPSDLRSLGVFANHGYKMMLGSDNKDWLTYEINTFPELRLRVTSFEQFCLFAERDINLIANILNNKESIEVIAKPHKDVDVKLRLYKEVNVLFGHKGTGKSEILKSLQTEFKRQGFDVVYYIGSDRDEQFNKFLDSKDTKRDLELVSANDCKEEIQLLNNWIDKTPTLLKEYINWKKSEELNRNKRKLLLTNLMTLPDFATDLITESQNQFELIKKISNDIDKIQLEDFLNEQEINQLLTIINILKDRLKDKCQGNLIEKYSIDLTNYSIKKIKQLADAKTSTLSRPSTTGFRDFSEGRCELKRAIDRIIKNLNCEGVTTSDAYLGTLDEKGDFYIGTQYRMLCEASKKEEFEYRDFTRLKNAKQYLETLSKKYLDIDLMDTLIKLKDVFNALNLSDISNFLGISKKVIDAEKKDYMPSSGEKGMLMLHNILSSDGDVFLLDEPDLGMGNSYIDATIRPKISSLGKSGKIVVVATHNANIAVRTLPFVSVYREHVNGVYKTFVGNPFINTLSNLDDDNETLSWTETSLKVLEGSEEAFYERKRIYESGNN